MKKVSLLFIFLLLFLTSCSFSSHINSHFAYESESALNIESACTPTANLAYASTTNEDISVMDMGGTIVAFPKISNPNVEEILSMEIESFLHSLDLPFKPSYVDFFVSEAYNTRTYTFFVSDTLDTIRDHTYRFSYDVNSFEKKHVLDFVSAERFLELTGEECNTVDSFEILSNGLNAFIGDSAYFISSDEFDIEKQISVFFPENYAPVIDKNEKYVAITFDDGPNPYSTTDLLKVLKDNDVKATFFMVGYNIEEYPGIVRKVYNDGHDIGIHSYGHANYSLMEFDDVLSDIDKCSDLIFNAVGKRPYLVRPPYGSINVQYIETDDYFFVNWNVDPCDWKLTSAEEISAEAVKYTRPGSIILLHDIYNVSCDAADIIIKKLKADGYRFVTISEYFNLQGKKPDNKLHFYLEDYNVKEN